MDYLGQTNASSFFNFNLLLFLVRSSDKRIACEEEFSDSEDEGDGRRDNQSAREGRSRKRNRAHPVENMVTNGNTENANGDEISSSNGAANSQSTDIKPESKVKSTSESNTPKEGSPKTVGSTTAAESTADDATSQPQDVSRKRYLNTH